MTTTTKAAHTAAAYLLETGRNHPGRVMWVQKRDQGGICPISSDRDGAHIFSTIREAQMVIGKFSALYGLHVVNAAAEARAND